MLAKNNEVLTTHWSTERPWVIAISNRSKKRPNTKDDERDLREIGDRQTVTGQTAHHFMSSCWSQRHEGSSSL